MTWWQSQLPIQRKYYIPLYPTQDAKIAIPTEPGIMEMDAKISERAEILSYLLVCLPPFHGY